MSYCRMGDHSDLYIYCDGWYYQCANCQFSPTGWTEISTLAALLEHLNQHRDAGDRVPGHTFERVERELAEENG